MRRTELLQRIETIEPALAKSDLLPILTHFCFTGSRALAYNDRIGIDVPLETDFQGAVPGRILLSLLKASRAEDVEMEKRGDNLNIKAASSRISLPILPYQDFPFKMPDTKQASALKPAGRPDFFHAIETCLRSVSTDTSVPDQLGVTMIVKSRTLDLFSTNNTTLSHARVGAPDGISGRAVLPTPFCEQMLSLSKGRDKIHLAVGKDHALFGADDVWMFGRLVEVDQPLDFHEILGRLLPKGLEDRLVEIPTKFKLIVARAAIITEQERVRTDIDIHDGVAHFHSKSNIGEVKDAVQLKGHPDLKLSVAAWLLKAGYHFFDKMTLTDRCVIMTHADEYYLVATRG